MRVSPRMSPITVTTTSRYETSTRNITSSPRNFSSSPSPKRDTHSPSGNYITSSTHRMSSPVTVLTHHRLSSPTTTTPQRLSSPSLNSNKVSYSESNICHVFLKPRTVNSFRAKRSRCPKRVRRTRRPISLRQRRVHHTCRPGANQSIQVRFCSQFDQM